MYFQICSKCSSIKRNSKRFKKKIVCYKKTVRSFIFVLSYLPIRTILCCLPFLSSESVKQLERIIQPTIRFIQPTTIPIPTKRENSETEHSWNIFMGTKKKTKQLDFNFLFKKYYSSKIHLDIILKLYFVGLLICLNG